jgi:FkbH-like protein
MFLACGFTPLHLQTFLAAELFLAAPEKRVEVQTGLFGDLAGSLERLNPAAIEHLVVLIEWSDIDPRLGARSLGGWRLSQMPSIIETAQRSLARLQRTILSVSAKTPTVVSAPSLPLPPMFTCARTAVSSHEAQLRSAVASFIEQLAKEPGVSVVNAQYLDELSPLAGRYDLKAELSSGFPYTLLHAGAVGKVLVDLIHRRAPKKGLITDLDDTAWIGILGDDGIEGISWDLEHHSQVHGLYQQVLASLASSGVLLAVASKNDPSAVRAAFKKRNLVLTEDDIFPLETNWGPKSESIARILKTWNVGADSVVFIDDSPMELAEVRTAFPEIECIGFPKGDDQAAWEMLKRLRDLFGKSAPTEEDLLRTSSIRQAESWREIDSLPEDGADDFLKAADAHIVFHANGGPADRRAFELVNKTNQFNLNGRRLTEGEWRDLFNDPKAFLVTASYTDKFGPLGKIAVIAGRRSGRAVHVDTWVMSCRAFSRRIEHQCLRYLFEAFVADDIVFDYDSTTRNGPLREFLTTLLATPPAAGARLSKSEFLSKLPPLFHVVEESVNV